MRTSGSAKSRRTASNARATEPASATSHGYARASGRLEASFPLNSVVRASSATAYPSDAKRRANAAPFPGPTPATTQTGFMVVPPSRAPLASGDEPADEPGQHTEELVEQVDETDHVVERVQERADQMAEGSG